MATSSSLSRPDEMSGNNQGNNGTSAPTIEEIGASMVVHQDRIINEMRTIYFAPANNGPFDLVLHHRNLLLALKQAAPELEIIPNDTDSPSYSALSLLPNTERAFRDHFEVLTEARDKGNRITVCHSIRTRSTLQDIKFKQGNNFLSYLRLKNITVIQDKFNRQRSSSIGFFIGVHPDLAHRGLLTLQLRTIIYSQVNLKQKILHALHPDYKGTSSDPDEFPDDVEVPSFELIVSNINYGSEESRITTRAIDVLVATSHSRLLKAILAEVDFGVWLQQGHFIGRGYMHMTDEEAYRKALLFQNAFIENTICFSIAGLTEKASNEVVVWNDKQCKFKDILLTEPSIVNIYPTTATTEHGKWLVLTRKGQDYRQATAFFDSIIHAFFAKLPGTNGMRMYHYPVAVRTMSENAVGKTIMRAQKVAQAIPQVVSVNLAVRPKRTQTVLMYDGNENNSTSPSGSPATKKYAATPSVAGSNTTMDETTIRQEFQELLNNKLTEVRSEFTKALQESEQRVTAGVQAIIEQTIQTTIERVITTTFDKRINETNSEVGELKTGMARLLSWVDSQENQPTGNASAMQMQTSPATRPPPPQMMHHNPAPWYPTQQMTYPGQYANPFPGAPHQDFDSTYGGIYNQSMYDSPSRADYQSGLDPGFTNNPNHQQ